jgi:hypothetical protein
MALTREYKKKSHGITWQSGHIYSFRYNAWENDPEPLIILMYSFSGTHPKSGRQWRFFQAINLSYVPKGVRKELAKTWIKEFERTDGNTRFTYKKVKRRYPGLLLAVRRYMYTPTARIQHPKEIPFHDWQKAVTSSFAKDFSKKAKTIFAKLRKGRLFQKNKRKSKKPRSLRKI